MADNAPDPSKRRRRGRGRGRGGGEGGGDGGGGGGRQHSPKVPRVDGGLESAPPRRGDGLGARRAAPRRPRRRPRRRRRRHAAAAAAGGAAAAEARGLAHVVDDAREHDGGAVRRPARRRVDEARARRGLRLRAHDEGAGEDDRAVPLGPRRRRQGQDGHGKTLAFLIPGLERIFREPPPRGHVGLLVVSPTRELAQQTADEAKALVRFAHAPGGGPVRVQVVVGGTNMNREASEFRQTPPAVLVATPGRLNDHLENTRELAPLCGALRALVFDEADQLLDMGFRPAIEKLLRALPPKSTRQTLLYSATFPTQLEQIAQFALRGNPPFELVDTVGHEEVATHKIPQAALVTSLDEQLAATLLACAEQARMPGHKVIVFLTTARQTQLFAEAYNQTAAGRARPGLEIHSRKSQPQRTRVSEEFRTADQGILFSSDVSARGMDYPDVSFVIQVGVPSDKAQYVHRLGRTARAGKGGSGLLVLADFETFFLGKLRDLPIQTQPPPPPAQLAAARREADAALHAAYAANLHALMAYWRGSLYTRARAWAALARRNANCYASSACSCSRSPRRAQDRRQDGACACLASGSSASPAGRRRRRGKGGGGAGQRGGGGGGGAAAGEVAAAAVVAVRATLDVEAGRRAPVRAQLRERLGTARRAGRGRARPGEAHDTAKCTGKAGQWATWCRGDLASLVLGSAWLGRNGNLLGMYRLGARGHFPQKLERKVAGPRDHEPAALAAVPL